MPSQFVYDEDVALRYDAAVPTHQGEVDFYLKLARAAQLQGLRTLEVACGTGRIAIPLARAGVPIVGIDVSTAMLDRAREKSAGLANAEWAEANMRDFDLSEQFGLITIPGGSLQLLTEVEDQLAALRCMCRHLVAGGHLAFVAENPDLVSIAEWLTTKRGTFVRNPARDYQHPQTGLHVRSWRTVDYHPSVQQSVGQSMIEELNDDGVVGNRIYNQRMTMHYFHRYELEHLLARCGFEVEALYSDFRKNAFRGRGPAQIWVARKSST